MVTGEQRGFARGGPPRFAGHEGATQQNPAFSKRARISGSHSCHSTLGLRVLHSNLGLRVLHSAPGLRVLKRDLATGEQRGVARGGPPRFTGPSESGDEFENKHFAEM